MLRVLNNDDLPAVQRLLCEGFPEQTTAFWQQGLQRLLAFGGNAEAGFPWGFGLVEEGQLVGVGLTPASLRHGADGSRTTMVNLAGWTIAPPYRWRALPMLRRMLADPDPVYLDLTPAPVVQRMLPRMGLRPVGAAAAVLLLPAHAVGRARGAQLQPLAPGQAPAFGPSAALLDAHRAWGCVPLVLSHADGEDLLVWRPLRLRGVAAAQLVYVQRHSVLRAHLPLLARHLLARGCTLLQCDSRTIGPHAWHSLHRSHGIWFARGGDFSDHTDFLGTERCLFGV